VSDRAEEKILKHLEIYRDPALGVKERDVKIHWSSDGAKCGVAIWGRMRGIIDIAKSREISVPLESSESPAITDPEWLDGFDDYLDQNQFIRGRQNYWKKKAKEYEPDIKPRPEEDTPIETNFVLYDKGLGPWFAVFEDEGETGYLYLYDSARRNVLQHLQIYDQAKTLDVAPEDVEVVWSADGAKCGVIIWNKMRGIIDRVKTQEGRVKLDSRESPGIGDKEWLKGFDLFRESDRRIQ
jgi:hypothetical protein